jgi:hypothetical protein
MGFLSPALLAGLLALAVPVIVHLVQRERRRVVEFPSLMFLRKIPRQAMKRRALRHWPLLALRLAVLTLLALAFARPFLRASAVLPAAGGGRDVIVLLDRSMSMGYGDRWDRAREEARRVFGGLGAGDVGSLMLFDTDVEAGPRATSDRTSLAAAVDTAVLTSRGTRMGPALRAAAGQLDRSRLTRREIVLISDFQRTAWDRATDARLPPGVVLQTRAIGEPATSNVVVAGLAFERVPQGTGERVTATARIVNRSTTPLGPRGITLEVDGREIARGLVSAGAGAVASHTFVPFTVGTDPARVSVRVEADALAGDNRFHSVITPARRVKVLVLQSAAPSQDASLYLTRALGVAADPGFAVTTAAASSATPTAINGAEILILNDSPPPAGAAGVALDARVRAGAGLLVALGERSAWPEDAPDLLPGTLGSVVDRSGTRGQTLGFVDYSHPIFEVFKAPRSGDLSAARVYRYRTLTPGSGVLARFDNGAIALAERRVGAGTVLAWATSLDSYWNDFALKPVFVPFILQTMRHIGRFGTSAPWHTVGDVIAAAPTGAAARENGVGAPFVPDEPGFVEVTPRDPAIGRVIAVNVPVEESDLTRVPPEDIAAAVVVPGGAGAAGRAPELTHAEQERRQSLWWYLAAALVVLLMIESVVAGRLPRLS